MLRLRGVSKNDAERISAELEAHPELATTLKGLSKNKEVEGLFKTIEGELKDMKKKGMAEAYAMTIIARKYSAEIAKHREELAPLIGLFQK